MIRLVQSRFGGVTVLEQVRDFIIARSPRAQAHKRDFVFARGVIRVRQGDRIRRRGATSFPISNDRSSRRCRPTRRAARPAPTVARRSTASTGGLPILLKLTAGQADDGRHASDMLDRLGQGQILLADRGYDSDGLRARARRARRRGRRQAHHARSRQRPPFSRRLYRFRHLVERFFNKLKHNRAAATRFEKRDANDLARVKLAASRIWMRFMSWRPSTTLAYF